MHLEIKAHPKIRQQTHGKALLQLLLTLEQQEDS